MSHPRRTVLMVDDDHELWELMILVFAEEGYRVLLASDLVTLKRLLVEEKVDVAIVDLMLAEDLGYIACRTVKEAGEAVPVVLRAPHVDVADSAKAKALNAEDCLTMPYDVEDFVDRVQRLCPSSSRLEFRGSHDDRARRSSPDWERW